MAAHLKNDRFLVDISVAGYEFPEASHNLEDANWLVIRVGLRTIHGAWCWQVEDAGALTWELDDCTHWLRALSEGQPVDREAFGFSEPDIQFETIRGEQEQVVGLTLHLMDEFQPPTKVLVPHENNIASLRFHTPPEVLRTLADGLADDLLHFPIRGERPAAT